MPLKRLAESFTAIKVKMKFEKLSLSILGRKRLCRGAQWFQQDGATPHTAKRTLDWLQAHFGHRVISRRCPIEWSPHSPDLTPPDFFLWGHLKDKVYSSKPKTIAELKANIVAETRRIGQDTIEAVIKNFTRRVAVCAQRGGRHIEHRISLFFKSSFLTVIIVVLS